VTQSPFGMVLQAIRENEPRARAIGYSVERYKIVAVMLSGLFAGLAGVLYAVQNKFAAPDFVFFLVSGEVVIFNVMGGMGTLVGPVAGAAFFLLLREGLSRYFTEYYLIPVGIIFTAMVIFMPQGLLGFAKRRLNQSAASASRAAEAALAARGVGQPLLLDQARVRHRQDDQLGDALAALDADGLGTVVDEQHLELAAVARVDETRCVEHGYALLHRQARARQHEPRVALGDGDGEPGGDEPPLARLERHGLRGAKVEPRVTRVRVGGQR
jgi:hypothetical protein